MMVKLLKQTIKEKQSTMEELQFRELLLCAGLKETRAEIERIEREIENAVDQLDWEQTKATMMGRDV